MESSKYLRNNMDDIYETLSASTMTNSASDVIFLLPT